MVDIYFQVEFRIEPTSPSGEKWTERVQWPQGLPLPSRNDRITLSKGRYVVSHTEWLPRYTSEGYQTGEVQVRVILNNKI